MHACSRQKQQKKDPCFDTPPALNHFPCPRAKLPATINQNKGPTGPKQRHKKQPSAYLKQDCSRARVPSTQHKPERAVTEMTQLLTHGFWCWTTSVSGRWLFLIDKLPNSKENTVTTIQTLPNPVLKHVVQFSLRTTEGPKWASVRLLNQITLPPIETWQGVPLKRKRSSRTPPPLNFYTEACRIGFPLGHGVFTSECCQRERERESFNWWEGHFRCDLDFERQHPASAGALLIRGGRIVDVAPAESSLAEVPIAGLARPIVRVPEHQTTSPTKANRFPSG